MRACVAAVTCAGLLACKDFRTPPAPRGPEVGAGAWETVVRYGKRYAAIGSRGGLALLVGCDAASPSGHVIAIDRAAPEPAVISDAFEISVFSGLDHVHSEKTELRERPGTDTIAGGASDVSDTLISALKQGSDVQVGSETLRYSDYTLNGSRRALDELGCSAG